MGGKSAIHSLGERFGKLVVTDVVCGTGAAKVTAACDCGGTWVGGISYLRNGTTKSCGCISREATTLRNRTHGMSGTKEHRIWKAMLTRCRNQNSQDYALYGGRGIAVCERWAQSFENFYADMGAIPPEKTSIDRVDSDKGYEPENCRWADATEQARNTSRNVRLAYLGKAKTIAEWCDELELDFYAVKSRVASGWSLEAAFTTPVKKIAIGEMYDFDGKSMTLSEWARHLDIGLSTLCYRLKKGFSPETTFTSSKLKSPRRKP